MNVWGGRPRPPTVSSESCPTSAPPSPSLQARRLRRVCVIIPFEMAKHPNFDITCPCCGALMKVDPETQAVISHIAPVKPKTFNDMEEAARA